MRHLIGLLLLTVASGLAATPVQVGPNTCKFGAGSLITTTLTCTLPSPVTARNRIVVGVHSRTNAATGITTITDSLSTPTTFTLKASKKDTAPILGVWLYIGTASVGGSDTISVTLNGNYYYGWLSVAEYRAEDITETDAGVQTGTGTNTSHSCGAFTPSVSGTQIIAITYGQVSLTTPTPTVDSPFTARVTMADASAKQGVMMDYFQATAGPVTPSEHNMAGAVLFVCAAVAFTPPVAAARRRQPLQSSGVGWAPAVVAPIDWSIAWVADQHPNSSGVPWGANVSYILSKKTSWNLQAVMFTGDALSVAGETMADFGTQGWNALVASGIPVISSIGNHDYYQQNPAQRETVLDSAEWDQYVGYQTVAAKSYGPVSAFSGVGNDVGSWTDSMGGKTNYAIRFAVNGRKFLGIALELYPRTAAMTWASNLAGVYPDHQILWLTHGNVTPFDLPCEYSVFPYCAGSSGGYESLPTSGQMLFANLLTQLPKSFLALSGHFPNADYGGEYWGKYETTASTGKKLYGLYQNFQYLTTANDIVVRISFHEVAKTFDVIGIHTTDESVAFSYMGLEWPQ
jgi:hypothetical protein